ncbi:MAG: hypothetical protein AB7N29_18580 [Vicinamibacterales bacterium]
MRLKIHGGTVSDGQASLCLTCRSATIIRGARLTDEIISCGKRIVRDEIRFAVASCTGYSDRSLPSLYDLEDVAWVLRSDARTKKIGFVRARDLKHTERHVLDEDDWA